MLRTIVFFLLCLSTAFNSKGQNLVSSQSWTVGNGSVGIFMQNGHAGLNAREMGVNPYGVSSVLWKAIPEAVYNGADGGWTTTNFAIDKSKLYRFAVWIKKTNSTDGYTYFGTGSDNLLNLDGTINSNAYFWYGDLPELNKWYLLVGYIHPSTDASLSHYGGIYDGLSGVKVAGATDFKFSSSSTIAQHRAYLYYDDNLNDRQYFWGPEVYQLADNTPLVESSGSAYFTGNAFFGSRVGIGTASPSAQLEVKGPYAGQSHVVINSLSTNNSGGPELQLAFNNAAKGFVWYVPYSDAIGFGRGNANNSLFVDAAGNVGIGTMTTSQKLTVKGKVHAEEVIINLSVPGPDYVFEETYDLMSLDQLKKFLEENKHLPEVPSAKKMQDDGVTVGEMEMLLLKKIEELTLHLIKISERVQMLEKENHDLKNKNENDKH